MYYTFFIITPLHWRPLFFCNTNKLWFKCVSNHISHKPLQDCDYRHKNLTKQRFCTKIKVPIVQIFYMGYSKLYFALSNLKKVVTFPCLLWQFILSLSSLTINLWIFCFFIKFASVLLVYTRKFCFCFFSTGFIVVSLHNLTQNNIYNITKGTYNLQNSNMCCRFSHYSHIYKKN